jgi:hypothetical protein
MANQTIVNIDGLMAAAGHTGDHTIDTIGSPYNLAAASVPADLDITGLWNSLTPIDGDIVIDCTGFDINFNADFTIGDPTGTYSITMSVSKNDIGVNATTSAITGNMHNVIVTDNVGNGISFEAGAVYEGSVLNCYDCLCLDNGLDGFNIHATGGTGVSTMNLYNCESDGHDATDTSDGATAHEFTVLNIHGGSYHDNTHGVHSVNNSTTNLFGNTGYGPVLFDDNLNVGDTLGYGIRIDGGSTFLNTSGKIICTGNHVGARIAGNAIADIAAGLSISGSILYDLNLRETSKTVIDGAEIAPSATNAASVYTENTSNLTIDNSTLDGTDLSSGSGEELVLLDSSGKINLSYNQFKEVTSRSAIYARVTGTTGTIQHNTFYNNGIHYRLGGASSLIEFIDNILSTATTAAIFNPSVSYDAITAHHNLFHANTSNLSGAGTIVSPDIIYTGTLDSLLIDAPNGNFSLPSGSPAIETASDGTNIGYWQGKGHGFTSPFKYITYLK